MQELAVHLITESYESPASALTPMLEKNSIESVLSYPKLRYGKQS